MHRTETFLSIIIICINYNKRRIDQILRCKHRLSGSPRLRSSLRKFTWDILDILECIIHLHIVLRTDIRDTIADYVLKIFLNILTDLFLVGGMKRGVAGAAVATVFSQGLSAVISLLLLRRAMRGFQAQEEKGKLYDPAMLKGMITVAIPSMLQQSIVSIGMLLVQSVVNGFGSSVLAGYTAGMRIESVCIVPMIAVGNAMSTFSAQNLGAGAPDRVKKGYHAAVRLVVSFAIVICVLLTLFHRQIIAAFLEAESERAAFDTGNAYLSFIAFFFVMIGLKAITDGVLRGAGDVFVFTLANLANLSIRVAFAFLFAQKLGVAAVWYAVPLGWTANFLISFCRYATGKWSRKQLIKVEEE